MYTNVPPPPLFLAAIKHTFLICVLFDNNNNLQRGIIKVMVLRKENGKRVSDY